MDTDKLDELETFLEAYMKEHFPELTWHVPYILHRALTEWFKKEKLI